MELEKTATFRVCGLKFPWSNRLLSKMSSMNFVKQLLNEITLSLGGRVVSVDFECKFL